MMILLSPCMAIQSWPCMERDMRCDGRTDGRSDRRTDGQSDGRTDAICRFSYRMNSVLAIYGACHECTGQLECVLSVQGMMRSDQHME